MNQKDVLKELQQEYEESIPQKVQLLSDLIDQVKKEKNKESLTALRGEAHKIAGNAGSFGFGEVSALCKEMDQKLVREIESFSPSIFSKAFIDSLDLFLTEVKAHFQSTGATQSSDQKTGFHIFAIATPACSLDIIERNKAMLPLDFSIEMDSKKALFLLLDPDFSPDAVMLPLAFTNGGQEGLDFLHKLHQERPDFSPIIILVVEDLDVETRILLSQENIDYQLEMPLSFEEFGTLAGNFFKTKKKVSERVLILDDDSDVAKFIAASLEEIDLVTLPITDETKLFDELKRFAPQVLILDIKLPRYSGLDLLKAIRADSKYADLIIICITAYVDTKTIEKAHQYLADEFLAKPIDKTVIQAVVSKLLKRKAEVAQELGTRPIIQKGKPKQKETVVIVDDDEDLAKVLKFSFESYGFKVVHFGVGNDAIKYLSQEVGKTSFSLFVLDRMLPDMDGLEILKIAQELFQGEVPIIILSVLGAEKDMLEGLSKGAVDYVAKPFSLSFFIQKVLSLIS